MAYFARSVEYQLPPGPNPIVRQMERARARIDQVRENSAREASCSATLTSTGDGEVNVPDMIRFGATFVQRPEVAHGYSIEGPLVEGHYPRAWGGVRDWQVDTRGYYIGCYVFLMVDVQDRGDTLYQDQIQAQMLKTAAEAAQNAGATEEYYSATNALNAINNQIMRAQATAAYVIHHDFRFTGTAMKDLPTYLFDNL